MFRYKLYACNMILERHGFGKVKSSMNFGPLPWQSTGIKPRNLEINEYPSKEIYFRRERY